MRTYYFKPVTNGIELFVRWAGGEIKSYGVFPDGKSAVSFLKTFVNDVTHEN